MEQSLDTSPRWVIAIWATPLGRLLFSMPWIALGIVGLSYYDEMRHWGVLLLWAAPALIATFTPQALEALLDLLRRRNTRPPVAANMGWLVQQPRWRWIRTATSR